MLLLEVISYGTTITRHISKHQEYLSFPRNALVEVYAKYEDPDVWLVKVTIISLCVHLLELQRHLLVWLARSMRVWSGLVWSGLFCYAHSARVAGM